MTGAKKITVFVPHELLRRAQEATGEGITPTVRRALELVASSRAYEELRRMRGAVELSVDVADLRDDRP